jgi:hypothetical protein
MKPWIKYPLCFLLVNVPAYYAGAFPPIAGTVFVKTNDNPAFGGFGFTDLSKAISQSNTTYAHSSYNGTGAPTASVHVGNKNVTAIGTAQATVQFIYSFDVIGDEGTQVPVHLDAFATSTGSVKSASIGGSYTAGSFVNLVEFTNNDCPDSSCMVGDPFLLVSETAPGLIKEFTTPTIEGKGLQTFSGDLMLDANRAYRVAIFGQASISGDVTASATADPYFFIEADFLASHPGYSLTFSDGVGNSPIHVPTSVPEQPVWAEMIIGLGIAGGSLRMRRQPIWQVVAPSALA